MFCNRQTGCHFQPNLPIESSQGPDGYKGFLKYFKKTLKSKSKSENRLQNVYNNKYNIFIVNHKYRYRWIVPLVFYIHLNAIIDDESWSRY